MDLSIIVPVYNTPPETLSACFASVLPAQDVSFELLIVDDGSREETAAFCRAYAAGRSGVRYLRQDNQGVSGARNTGIAHAAGEYILFVDSDDMLIPGTVGRQHLEGGWDLVFFDHELIVEGRSSIRKPFFAEAMQRLEKGAVLTAACSNLLNSCCAKLFRREFLLTQELTFDREMIMAEDALFVFRAILAAETMTYAAAACYRYAYSEDNWDSRLARHPLQILHNHIRFFRLRSSGLHRRAEAGVLPKADLPVLNRLIAEHLIRDLFESVGLLYLMDIPFPEAVPDIRQALGEAWQAGDGQFSPRTKGKYFLLKKDWKPIIWLYAVLRKRYISYIY